MTAPRRNDHVQIYDNQWTPVVWKGLHEACCDCGLEHVISYRVNENGQLEFKARRLPKRRAKK